MDTTQKHGENVIRGNTPFFIPVERFYISPLPSVCHIYLIEDVNGVPVDKQIQELDADKFTAVEGVAESTWRLDVDQSVEFKVKW